MTASNRLRVARWTGLAYLGIVVLGLFAELAVRGRLVVPGDAAETAARIAGAPGLFGLGLGADLLMVALDVGVAFGLYRLLRGVDRRLAVAATGFRLLQASVIAANLLHVARAFALARGAVSDAALAGPALAAMERHALVYDVALIAFGLACLALSRLLYRATAPRALAWGLAATGLVYLTGSAAAVLAPTVQAAMDPLYAIAIVVEPAFAIWLLARGGRPGALVPREVNGGAPEGASPA